MDFGQLYHFLFETYAGIGSLILVGFVITLLVAVILERRTRKRFKKNETTDESWSFFEDEEGSDENNKDKGK